jgi:hypothetical protein
MVGIKIGNCMNDEFIQLVTKMRDYQQQYFEARKKNMFGTAHKVLAHAKAYEAKVDQFIKEYSAPANQTKLF